MVFVAPVARPVARGVRVPAPVVSMSRTQLLVSVLYGERERGREGGGEGGRERERERECVCEGERER